MSVTSNQSGSQTAAIGTEHTLGAAITTSGVYVLVVDSNAMANGDVLELRAYSKCKTGSTSRQARIGAFANVQVDPNKYSVPIPIDTQVTFTLKQTAGVGRTYDWNILSL